MAGISGTTFRATESHGTSPAQRPYAETGLYDLTGRPTSPNPETRLFELTGERISSDAKASARRARTSELSGRLTESLRVGEIASPLVVEMSERSLERRTQEEYRVLGYMVAHALAKLSSEGNSRVILVVQALKRLVRNDDNTRPSNRRYQAEIVRNLANGHYELDLYDNDMNEELRDQVRLALQMIVARGEAVPEQ
jgi:hypothetical protein